MRILLLNPNTSVDITARLAEAAKACAAPTTEIVTATAARGVPYIATRAEATIGGAGALEMLADLHTSVDAAVIAAFGDPGLGGARELFPIPVIGMAEAGMLTACMLGRSFGIVTFAEALEPWYRECVEWHGLTGRCAGIRTLSGGFRSISSVQEDKETALVELACRSVIEDGADVVLLAGAPLAGMANKVRERIPVPVVDCIGAAIKQAEVLLALNTRKATAGTFRRPDPKPSIGLPATLQDWLGGAR